MTAPAIKSGIISVDTLSEQEAIEAMIADPLLIRRPLMDIEGRKICGFRYDELDALIGLLPSEGREQEIQALRSDTITVCPFVETEANCDKQTVE